MPDNARDLSGLSTNELLEFDRLCDQFHNAWLSGNRPPIESFLACAPAKFHKCLLPELIGLEIEVRITNGERPARSEYLERFPSCELPADLSGLDKDSVPTKYLDHVPDTESWESGSQGDEFDEELGKGIPDQIDRYRIVRPLGSGGFGRVYLAEDDQLQRRVAIKVPHDKLLSRSADILAYLTEARIVAGLDHPNIVPVYDVGDSPQCPFYVVSKFIEGTTLAARIKEGKQSIPEVIKLTAIVAETLSYAHQKGLVHRDVKPANILLDLNGKPYVADFGLALKEENLGRGPRYAGTLPYMSPEQAQGEGHRVDGRSDVFSLGIVLYEQLTGKRPFHADSKEELLERVIAYEPRPPRQWSDSIPKELERICLRALMKRASERYTTAGDMAADLRQFEMELITKEPRQRREWVQSSIGLSQFDAFTPIPGNAQAPDSGAIKIVPHGLRSFDQHDADFFLELLPGPRDREGLPDSIRFWKTRIECTEIGNTFAVGLIYGPSGCGKSSLVKAGLLPRLSKKVTAVYVESTADATESRLLGALKKRFPETDSELNLKEKLANLRRGEGILPGEKLLIVLDQFEQWLHTNHQVRDSELVQALRQCDGARVQCIVMVRDDFWLALTRFMGELEADLLQGQNTAVIDLFDIDHARKVLAALGRAFGKLPSNPRETNKDQNAFLNQSVSGLAREGKVVCVHLSLFADMVKGKPWLLATLKAVGGMEGIGVSFLDETFCSAAANPKHRLHQRAACAVLGALLPESGTDIKGHMRSRQELLAISGYSGRTNDFVDLIHILDHETRLITPTTPEETVVMESSSLSSLKPDQRYYQLTHDYLVQSLRDWLTRAHKATWRGRARLRLAERGAIWSGKPDSRYLPSGIEWGSIRLLTSRKQWTTPQRNMMRQADRYYAIRMIGLIAILFLMTWGVWEYQGRTKARALESNLLRPGMAGVSSILDEMANYHHWTRPLMLEALDKAEADHDPEKLLKVRLALLRWDSTQADEVLDSLLRADSQAFPVVRTELSPHKDQYIESLWYKLTTANLDPDKRFRAACALADFAPNDSRWAENCGFVVESLLTQDALALNDWKNVLDPVGPQLLLALAEILANGNEESGRRSRAIELYAGFSRGQANAFLPLEAKLSGKERRGLSEAERAKQKASIAAALIALNQGSKVWPLFCFSNPPTVRSFLIEEVRVGVDPRALKDRLLKEEDHSAKRALILAMGSFPAERLPEMPPILIELYRNDIDPGVRSAAGWLLRKWKHEADVRKIDAEFATGLVDGNRHWFVTRQGLGFAILEMPNTLMQRAEKPGSHGYRLAVATTETTVAQFLLFKGKHNYNSQIAPTVDCPINTVTWFDAAQFCNWLSEKNGIDKDQWCYQVGSDGKCTPFPDYLDRSGYRLPTEAEWEFACRAGASSRWSCGEVNEELIGRYAWWYGNSSVQGLSQSHPVGTLKPNDFGLFDMHGNVSEWCQSLLDSQSKDLSNQSVKKEKTSPDAAERGVRGGTYLSHFSRACSDTRSGFDPSIAVFGLGFRPVRRMP